MEYNYYCIIFTDCTTKDLLGNLLSLFTSSFVDDKKVLGKKILNLLYFKTDLTEEIKELYFALVEKLFEIMSIEDKLLVSFYLLTIFSPKAYKKELKSVIDKHLKFSMEYANIPSACKFPINKLPAAMLYYCCLQVGNLIHSGTKLQNILSKDEFLVQYVGALFRNGQIKEFPEDLFGNDSREEDWIAYLLLLIEMKKTLKDKGEAETCSSLIFTAFKDYITNYKPAGQIIELAINVIEEDQRIVIKELMNFFNLKTVNSTPKQFFESVQEEDKLNKSTSDILIKGDVNSSDEDLKTIIAELTQKDELQGSLLDFSLDSNSDILGHENKVMESSMKPMPIKMKHIGANEFTSKTLFEPSKAKSAYYGKVMECRAGIIRVPEYLDREFITKKFTSFIRRYIEIQDREIANSYESFHKHFKNQ